MLGKLEIGKDTLQVLTAVRAESHSAEADVVT
jgi:hypothetical protein